MPSAPPVTAVLNALTISLTLLFSEPVHWYEQPSSLHASSAPYFVGTKNGLVVTWLTNTNFRLPFAPKMPAAGLPLDWLVLWAFVVDGLLLPPHAEMMAVARPAPAPVSAVRRVIARQRDAGVSSSLPSAHSRRSIASFANSDSWSGTTAAPFPGQVGQSCRYSADPPDRSRSSAAIVHAHIWRVKRQAHREPAGRRRRRAADRLWNAGHRRSAAALGDAATRPAAPPAEARRAAKVNANSPDDGAAGTSTCILRASADRRHDLITRHERRTARPAPDGGDGRRRQARGRLAPDGV